MKNINKKTKCLLATSAAALIGATVAYASPQYDREIWYFADADKTQLVGYKHYSCSNRVTSWGTFTNYRVVFDAHPCKDWIDDPSKKTP
jgi:hypothetical protein